MPAGDRTGEGAPWHCPVCRHALGPAAGPGRALVCPGGHAFDVARQGYVNLLVAGQRRSRRPGDNREMVDARRRFLATGAYAPITTAVSRAVAGAVGQDAGRPVVLDVGCGEGHHTRAVAAAVPATVAGIDVSRHAVSHAARTHGDGWYAVASAGDLPLGTAAVDVVMDVFGPVVPGELARVVRPAGAVVTVHPGARHLGALRALVYADSRPHEPKPPLRAAAEQFAWVGSVPVTFPMVVTDAAVLTDLFTMTPYRWHAPPDMAVRLAREAAGGFETEVDVVVTTYLRRG